MVNFFCIVLSRNTCNCTYCSRWIGARPNSVSTRLRYDSLPRHRPLQRLREQARLAIPPALLQPLAATFDRSCHAHFELMMLLQVGQHLPSPVEHFAGNPGQAGDVDAVALVGAAGGDLVQEDDLLARLA